MEKIFKRFSLNLKDWTEKKYFQLAILNIFLIFLVLLKSAGYFYPYFPITINSIVVLGILASIVLLRFNSRFSFILAIMFWSFTALFRILNIVPWAERMAIYSYESFAIGTIHLILEAIGRKRKEVLR